ncbi:ceramidase domain-containing protein [Dactylosporangium sp. NPDC049525]|uniref:ceramidase domain-containing protein n=1 Tax=Dactylosporangium sp. NPDC049525 TaxID=3154730 RepID=UPI00344620B5
MDRDLRPVAAAGVTAVLSCGLLAAAVRSSWLGADVGRGAGFCEAGRDWVVRQPANTFSNVGFVVAGLLIAWHAGARGDLGAAAGSAGPRRRATALACLVVLLGPGSAAMHATQSALGGHLDLLSMYLVAAFAVAYATMRWLRGGTRLLAGVFLGALAGCEVIGSWDVELPVVMHPGNAVFGALLLTATALEVAVMRRGGTSARHGYAYGSFAAILTAFAIWNVSKAWLCDPHSLVQGHAIWHLLCAVSAYLLYRYYASERSPAAAIPSPDPARRR